MSESFFPQSKVQYTLYHYVASEYADMIRKEGFKTAVELGKSTGGSEIDGIYFTSSSKNYWGEDSNIFEQIAVKVDLRNPLDLSFMSNKESYTEQEQWLIDEAKRLKELGEENYYKANGENGKYNKSLLATETTKAFKEAGYDGLIFEGAGGHMEHIVFDKRAIYIIDTKESVQEGNASEVQSEKPNEIKEKISTLKNITNNKALHPNGPACANAEQRNQFVSNAKQGSVSYVPTGRDSR